MLNLLLAVLFSSFLYIIFKFFTKHNIDTLQAIIFNYIIAFFAGTLINPTHFHFKEIICKPWLIGTIYLGFLFICVFNLVGKTTQNNGISVATVSSKMAMIIPILFGIFFFNEKLNIYKFIGIIIALLAVYFTSKKENTNESSNYLLPVLLFLGAGIIDTSMNYLQHFYLKKDEAGVFASTTFIFAFLFGLTYFFISNSKNKKQIKSKNLIAGIILGIPNYFSMYFLIKALQNKDLESATIFTLINIGVILLTTIFSVLIFNEKIKKQNIIGILLAIAAVFLVTQ